MQDCVLLRYGEVGLKSKKTRMFFEKKYVLAIKESLSRNNISDFLIKNFGGRFVVFCENSEEITNLLLTVPGIQSASPAKKILVISKKLLIMKLKKELKESVVGKTFCVRVKRLGKHNFNSMELASELGSALYKFSLGVNLKNPDIIINLEIRNKDCFFYTKNFQGVGGLPPAISDKVLCLFSGGIDSPVAAFELIKRGCKVDFLFVNLVNNQVLNDVLRIYNFLIKRFCFGYKPKMFVVDGKKLVKLIKKETPDSLKQIAFKIVLYKISELIVRKKDYLAFATGESLSQKSSQTLKSLLFIENSVSTPVLRPLLCLDKIEITNIARKIGTLSSSEKIKEFCNLTTGPVSTSPREEDIQKIPCFDFEINKAVEDFYINKGIANMLPVVEKKISKTKKLVFVDVRSEALQKRNPLKVDLNIPYAKLSENIDIFKKDKEYLLICEFGVLSEDAASELRKKGFKAESIDINAFQKHLQ